MKFQFDPDLDFQHEAINAVVDLFDGQEVCQTNFTVAPLKHDPQTLLAGRETGDAWAEGLMPNGSESMADKIILSRHIIVIRL